MILPLIMIDHYDPEHIYAPSLSLFFWLAHKVQGGLSVLFPRLLLGRLRLLLGLGLRLVPFLLLRHSFQKRSHIVVPFLGK